MRNQIASIIGIDQSEETYLLGSQELAQGWAPFHFDYWHTSLRSQPEWCIGTVLLMKQFGIRVEQVREHLGWCFATVLWVIGGHQEASKGTQRVQWGQKRSFLAICWSGGSNLVEQCGIRVEQVPAHPWWCIGTVLWVRWAIEGAIGPGPIGSKTAKNGPLDHKWIWWLQSGGSVSINE